MCPCFFNNGTTAKLDTSFTSVCPHIAAQFHPNAKVTNTRLSIGVPNKLLSTTLFLNVVFEYEYINQSTPSAAMNARPDATARSKLKKAVMIVAAAIHHQHFHLPNRLCTKSRKVKVKPISTAPAGNIIGPSLTMPNHITSRFAARMLSKYSIAAVMLSPCCVNNIHAFLVP